MYANKKMNVIISCVGIVLFAIIITAVAARFLVYFVDLVLKIIVPLK
jgi:hypothetical protein